MSSFTKNVYGISSKTETTVEQGRITIKSKLTENFILLLLLAMIYLLITEATNGATLSNHIFTPTYLILGILLIFSYRRIILIDGKRREIHKKLRLIVSIQSIYSFDELKEVAIERKMKTITGVALPLPVFPSIFPLLANAAANGRLKGHMCNVSCMKCKICCRPSRKTAM